MQVLCHSPLPCSLCDCLLPHTLWTLPYSVTIFALNTSCLFRKLREKKKNGVLYLLTYFPFPALLTMSVDLSFCLVPLDTEVALPRAGDAFSCVQVHVGVLEVLAEDILALFLVLWGKALKILWLIIFLIILLWLSRLIFSFTGNV